MKKYQTILLSVSKIAVLIWLLFHVFAPKEYSIMDDYLLTITAGDFVLLAMAMGFLFTRPDNQ